MASEFWRWTKNGCGRLTHAGWIDLPVQAREEPVPRNPIFWMAKQGAADFRMIGMTLNICTRGIRPSFETESPGYPTKSRKRCWSASSRPAATRATWCSILSAVAAQPASRSTKLGRKWIGIDVTHLAINLIKRRLKRCFRQRHSV